MEHFRSVRRLWACAELREILDPAGLFLWATASEHALRADILTSHVRTVNESAEPLNWNGARTGYSN